MRRRIALLAIAAAVGLAFTTAAQEAQEPVQGITVAEHEEYGSYLTDSDGRTLYLFVTDQATEPYQEPHQSSCYEQCAEAWPPALVDTWPAEEGFIGEGVDEELVATVEREDASLQLAYGNWPLYYFSGDEEPGETAGQGANDVWYIVSPEAEGIGREEEDRQDAGAADEAESESEEADGANDEEAVAALMDRGEDVFSRNCAACHGAEGEGAQGPELASGTRTIANKDRLIRQILRGGERMPSFKQLSDNDVAAVATFVRNSWENDHGPVAAEEVSEWR